MKHGYRGIGLALVAAILGGIGVIWVLTSGAALRGAEEAGSGTTLPSEDAIVDAMSMTGEVPMPEKDAPIAEQPGAAKAILAGGCFWCTEAVFEAVTGVKDVVSGYAGDDKRTATYQHVLTGETKHAEAIEITYDPSVVTFGALLRVFFATHDPTTLNRQGPDKGPQYRSAVFYANEEQRSIAEAYIAQLNAAGVFPDALVTTLEPLEQFYTAEDYHQDYVKHNPNNPYVRHVAIPKVEKLEKLKGEEAADPS
jgi:peptide-methionine (S)-S-oxide reductase